MWALLTQTGLARWLLKTSGVMHCSQSREFCVAGPEWLQSESLAGTCHILRASLGWTGRKYKAAPPCEVHFLDPQKICPAPFWAYRVSRGWSVFLSVHPGLEGTADLLYLWESLVL